jgi:hypothetical protein
MAPASYRERGTGESHRPLYNELKYERVTRAGATFENCVPANVGEFVCGEQFGGEQVAFLPG